MIQAEKASFPVVSLCSALGVSRSGFYAWAKRKPSARARQNEALLDAIRTSHARHRGTYGSPRIRDDLRARKIVAGRHRVARIMRANGIRVQRRRRYRKTTMSNHDLPVAPNLLERNFFAETLDEVWAGDITYVWTTEGWSYLAVVMDLCSRRIIGWAFADHLRTELVTAALEMALQRRRPSNPMIFHSDRGCQYASAAFRQALTRANIKPSMSRKGDCWDNAVVESFFATFRAELTERCEWATRSTAQIAIHEYIEVFYNRIRRHSYLGSISPCEFESTGQPRSLKVA